MSHESPILMLFPLFILSIGGFLIGFISKDMMLGVGISF
jgi:NADH:ubiquinone oxidoreductase subunit 5 (subunit L)/multisubunit Na+/H+ antiporter MnhA subunit